ncbi:MAG: TonB-dependent receptor [Acidobacteriaceae bacterium]|nr:TonB-dependent receptor [Acidobacteriaceae bacterium]
MFAPAVPLLFLLLGGSPLAASAVPAPGTPRAHLSGFVSDASGAGVPNAAITLETQDGQNVAATVSDATGHYRLEFTVRAGVHYSERVIAKGFHTSVQQDVPLLEGVDRVNDIHLSIGSASETVTVTPTESKGNGELGTVAQAGILGTLSLDEMPYSATSYTSQIVLDQQAQTVSDVLRNEVGIQEGNGRYSENQYLTLRGFTLEVGQALYNGIPGLVDARSPSIENIDRFEIFKGPSSFLNGASPYGAPGGTVNMVTKRAGEQPYYRFDGGYSSNSEKEGHIDLGRRFFANNALGVRVTLGGRAGNTPIDNQAENVADGAIGLDYRGKKWHGSFDLSDEARSMLGSRDAIYFDYVTGNVPQAPKLT